jgi:hypothetical protein
LSNYLTPSSIVKNDLGQRTIPASISIKISVNEGADKTNVPD